MDVETYRSLPTELDVREVQAPVTSPGFRTPSLVVVSSFLNPQDVSASHLGDLYRKRWSVELKLRDIKTLMQLDALRRTTPDYVHQELWTGLLAYNLIRQSLLQSALAGKRLPCELSFTALLQMIANTRLVAAGPPFPGLPCALQQLRFDSGQSHRVGQRVLTESSRARSHAVHPRVSCFTCLADKPRRESSPDSLTIDVTFNTAYGSAIRQRTCANPRRDSFATWANVGKTTGAFMRHSWRWLTIPPSFLRPARTAARPHRSTADRVPSETPGGRSTARRSWPSPCRRRGQGRFRKSGQIPRTCANGLLGKITKALGHRSHVTAAVAVCIL